MTTAVLSHRERQVLRTVQFRAREERWSHKTLGALRARGLVVSESRYSGAIYHWTITDAGKAALEAA